MNPSFSAVIPRCIFIFAVIGYGFLSSVQPIEGASQYSSHLWQMEDGLPHSIVQAITQTKDGYLWVGTREGLARFDGTSFEAFELSRELAHPSILVLYGA